MRISDWSSDVCSSDLCATERGRPRADAHGKRTSTPDSENPRSSGPCSSSPAASLGERDAFTARVGPAFPRAVASFDRIHLRSKLGGRDDVAQRRQPVTHGVERRSLFHQRSEEHTSELQSLMRISYAVF